MPDRHTASISTHVLDTERGEPARGVPVTLSRHTDTTLQRLSSAETGLDGRVPDLLEGRPLEPGTYQISFDAAAYFHAQGREADFFQRVTLEFEITDTRRQYHVPLLLSRYACSSYRGSP
jgi:5-hydroxyisourate hydrolase